MKNNELILFLTIYAPIAMVLFFSIASCTLSFQNISTHGVASDLVDENLETDPDFDADVDFPGRL